MSEKPAVRSTYVDKLRELETRNADVRATEQDAFYKLLGYNLMAAREKRGWGQNQTADLFGLSQSMLCRFETGESRISVYDLIIAAKVLGKKVTELLPP